MVAKDEKGLAEKYSVTIISQATKVTAENLQKLTEFIENKGVKPHIDKIYPLDSIKEAFGEQEKGEVLGKIVINIQ